MNERGNLAFADAIADGLSTLIGLVGVGLGVGIALGLVTSAVAGPIGIALAVIGLVLLIFKWIWDSIFPQPTPIQLFVNGPLTTLGVVT